MCCVPFPNVVASASTFPPSTVDPSPATREGRALGAARKWNRNRARRLWVKGRHGATHGVLRKRFPPCTLKVRGSEGDATMTAHPMDLFPIRPLRFDAERLANADPVWSQSCPDFSRFINALGLHVPFFERFLISMLRTYRDDLRSGALRDDVRRIIGQEAHHAFNFEQWNAAMCARYPHLGEVEANAKEAFERAFARSDRRFRVGFTAGYETFTFLGRRHHSRPLRGADG